MTSKQPDRTRPTMRCVKDGPIVVQSLETMTDHDGTALPTTPSMALCRCGQSRTKPQCDGSHTAAGFSDEKTTDGRRDKQVHYAGADITIHDNRGVCSHAGYCTSNLPAVWRMNAEPWIDPNGAASGEVTAVIRQCPSGALSYTLDGVEHRGQDREAAVRLAEDGPYHVEGGVTLEDVAQGTARRRIISPCAGAGRPRTSLFATARIGLSTSPGTTASGWLISASWRSARRLGRRSKVWNWW